MHEVVVNRLGGLSLPRKSVVRLTDRPDMTLDVYRGRKTTIQQYNNNKHTHSHNHADRPFFDNIEVTSDKCVQGSIHETKYNIIKVCTDLKQLSSGHASSIAILNLKPDQIYQFLLL